MNKKIIKDALIEMLNKLVLEIRNELHNRDMHISLIGIQRAKFAL